MLLSKSARLYFACVVYCRQLLRIRKKQIFGLINLYRLGLYVRETGLNKSIGRWDLLCRILKALGREYSLRIVANHIFPYSPKGQQNLHVQSDFSDLDKMVCDKMSALQYESSYKRAKFLVAKANDFGFSSSIIRILTTALHMGYGYNRTVLFDSTPSPYEFCFKPITNHPLGDVVKKKIGEEGGNNLIIQCKKINWFILKGLILNGRFIITIC